MSKFTLKKKQDSISVQALFVEHADRFKVRLACGKGHLRRKIRTHTVHFPGLALTGFLYHFHHEKIQFIADMEWHYLNSLDPAGRTEALNRIFSHPVPVVVVTNNRTPHPELLHCAEQKGIPVLITELSATQAQQDISGFLEEYFAPKLTLHASLVDVYGIGLLYTGSSGIGKSECVLDLVERGHRLVADDIITITRIKDNLIGQGSPLLGHHMEIRGIGIINIESLFGIRAIRTSKRIEVMVELVRWDPQTNFERLGLTDRKTDLLGVPVDKVAIPIFPGKNITVISEIIAMNMLLKYHGVNTANEFNQRLMDTLKEKHREKTQQLSDF